MDLLNTAAVLTAYIDADIPAFMWGAPGIGKSQVVKQTAVKLDRVKIEERLSTLESIDLRGVPGTGPGGVVWHLPTMFQQLWDAHNKGQKTLLFLDEMNAASPSCMAAAFQLVLDRCIGPHQLPPDCAVVAAGNRQSDKAAAQRMPSALANRFAHIDCQPDVKSWLIWANKNNIHPLVCAFIHFRPALLHKMEGNDLRAFCTPRAWESVSKLVDAPDSIRQMLIAGLIGEEAAGEFDGFVRTFRDLPTIPAIIRNPDTATVPNGPGNQWAVSSALARYADRTNFAAIMTYAERLPRDYEIALVIDATRRDEKLKETRTYIDWAARNSDVII